MDSFTFAINLLLGASAFAALILVRERLGGTLVRRAVVVL